MYHDDYVSLANTLLDAVMRNGPVPGHWRPLVYRWLTGALFSYAQADMVVIALTDNHVLPKDYFGWWLWYADHERFGSPFHPATRLRS
jgi:hypothetical protein